MVGPHDPVYVATVPALRSATFATVAVVVSLTGHLAAGGVAPGAVGLALALVVVAAAHSALLARRERSWAVIVTSLGLAQAGLHLVFGGVGGHGASTMTAAHHVHHHASPAVGHVSGVMLAGHVTGAMLAGHAAAALLLGWFLREGERVVWAAARRATAGLRLLVRRLGPAVVRALLDALPAAPVRPDRRGAAPERRRRSVLRSHRVAGGRLWRGPPQQPRVA